MPFGAVLRFIFVGFFFNNFLPANVGGDVMRGFSLARYTDRGADAAVSVIVDRVIGLMAYMTTAALAAFIAVNVTGGQRTAAGRVGGGLGRLSSWRPDSPSC